MFLMRADLLLGQVVGGWALEIETFLGLEPSGECHFGPKKGDFQAPPPLPMPLVMDLARITYRAI